MSSHDPTQAVPVRPPDDAVLAEAKRALRRTVRASLARLTDADRAAGSGAICEHLMATWRARGRTLSGVAMVFVPMGEEVDLGAFCRAWTAGGGAIAVPRVDWGTRTMEAVRVSGLPAPAGAGSEGAQGAPAGWASGRGGMLEPEPGLRGMDPSEITLVAAPGLAFDAFGNRLGRGAGFYDRFLSRTDLRRALKIGVAFDVQIVARVPISSGDVAMDGVVTPAGDILGRPGGERVD